jgi:tetratricopeptide (TPR) repeat protein
MTSVKKLALLAATAASLAMLAGTPAQAAGGGSMSMPSSSRDFPERQMSPEDQAKASYNSGVKLVKKADGYEADAAKASSPEKQEKLHKKAAAAYEKARGEFEDAVTQNPSMHEAWNYIGYTQRHLGRYDTALSAYARALQIKPGYPQAIEYRAEAYLGLNRLDDARGAYMELFSSSRPLANQLLASMQKFVAARRQAPGELDAASLDAFAKWVDERAQIAQQTASLDTSSPGASWR